MSMKEILNTITKNNNNKNISEYESQFIYKNKKHFLPSEYYSLLFFESIEKICLEKNIPLNSIDCVNFMVRNNLNYSDICIGKISVNIKKNIINTPRGIFLIKLKNNYTRGFKEIILDCLNKSRDNLNKTTFINFIITDEETCINENLVLFIQTYEEIKIYGNCNEDSKTISNFIDNIAECIKEISNEKRVIIQKKIIISNFKKPINHILGKGYGSNFYGILNLYIFYCIIYYIYKNPTKRYSLIKKINEIEYFFKDMNTDEFKNMIYNFCNDLKDFYILLLNNDDLNIKTKIYKIVNSRFETYFENIPLEISKTIIGNYCNRNNDCETNYCDEKTKKCEIDPDILRTIPSGYSCFYDDECESKNCINNICGNGKNSGSSCEENFDCFSGKCEKKRCVGEIDDELRSVGNPCLSGNQCKSGYCVDNVCTGDYDEEMYEFDNDKDLNDFLRNREENLNQ